MRTHALAPILVVLAACSTSTDGWSSADDSADAMDTATTDTSSTDTAQDTGTDTGDTGGSAVDTADTSDTGPDTGGDTSDTADTGASDPGCRSGASMHTGTVLAALPWNRSGDPADVWARLTLGADGTLTDTGARLTMGRATVGQVAFSPDGTLVIAATERGALAIYDVTHDTVVDTAWDGGFSATSVTFDPSGEIAWVVDGNWPESGGGLWRVRIGCDTGIPSDPVRVLEAKNPAKFVQVDATTWALVGREIPGTSTGDDVAFVRVRGETVSVIGGADPFGDEEAIVSDAALMGDVVVIGDNSSFSGVPNRIVGADLAGARHGPLEVEDPMGFGAFPGGQDALLVSSGFGDALYVVDRALGRATRVRTSAAVQLPGSIVTMDAGADRLALVAEVSGLRRVRLGASGTATDLGVTSLGGGMTGMIGAIGVAP